MNLKEWCEKTFSKEFLEEADREYIKAQIDGRDYRIKELEEVILSIPFVSLASIPEVNDALMKAKRLVTEKCKE
jgi:hypothetical protein